MIALRPATVSDTSLIASMHTISWQHSYRTMLPDRYLDHDIVEERLNYWKAKMDKSPHRMTQIAENDEGQAIGFFCGDWDPDTRMALLDNLHVLPEHQGKGAGGILMRAFKNWAVDECGATQFYLFVLEQNKAAIEFYERTGWVLAESFQTNLAGADVSSRRYVYHV